MLFTVFCFVVFFGGREESAGVSPDVTHSLSLSVVCFSNTVLLPSLRFFNVAIESVDAHAVMQWIILV